MREKLIALLGTWSRPPDFPAKVAVGLAVFFAIAVMFGRGRTLLFGFDDASDAPREGKPDSRSFLATLGLAAALLSIAYVSSYLRGGPRIVDATTYFLQGRALSHGDLAWTPLDPSASARGRFLIYRDGLDGASLGGIFPPGYPLLLSLGFMVGAPMIVGPLLAAALVVATYHLARALAEECGAPGLSNFVEPIARSAAILSVFSAALRYHTADTMSHGASALGITLALTCAIRARAKASASSPHHAARGAEAPSPLDHGRREAIGAGLALGYVVATRPASAIAIGLIVAWLLWKPGASIQEARWTRRGELLRFALPALLPGLLLLVASQRAVTGSWLATSQRMYYALSDGPPGCFRWGFGKGTGCLHEHGEFVSARMPDGYGVVEAAATTLRRLRMHLLDVANFEPLALLVVLPALLRRRLAPRPSVILAATVLVALQMLAYLPFYFDGDYPGGGARFFADVLPIEHALMVLGVAAICAGPRRGAEALVAPSLAPPAGADVRFTRGAFVVFALAVAGFAIHASYEHGKLRDRDGGRPMFEPDVLARASLSTGLVFVDTDHGFALGHDPGKRATNGVVVARLRSDDRDRMLFDMLDRPPSYLYQLEPPSVPGGEITPRLVPWAPPESGPALRFEAEAEWPPLAQENGFAVPVWTTGCASGSRALVLTPSQEGQRARATITVPVPSAGRWALEPHIVHGARAPFTPAPSDSGHAKPTEGRLAIGAEQWTFRPQDACAVLPAKELDLVPPHAMVTIEASNGPIGVDYFTLRKVK